MTKPTADKIAKRPQTATPRESDFFYDELMTAQPDATREFLRARLAQSAAAAKKPK